MKETINKTRSVISLNTVSKTYETTAGTFPALKKVSLSIEEGTFAAIVGRSGSGKSTLLNMITGIDHPTTGAITLNSVVTTELSETALTQFRGKNIGIVFQFFQLIPTLTALENVLLPMDFCNYLSEKERIARAKELLNRMGLSFAENKYPTELSGGEQQRVAIARALANNPKIVVADEPTGNLDSTTAADIFSLFKELASEGITIVMVTHDNSLAQQAGTIFTLDDGNIISSKSEIAASPVNATI